MTSVWKFELEVNDFCAIDMPDGARVLTVQVQNGAAYLWAEVDPDRKRVNRNFRIVGTGHTLPSGEKRAYVGTFQLRGGALVFHVFEVL